MKDKNFKIIILLIEKCWELDIKKRPTTSQILFDLDLIIV
jgi:hypothetical protein